MFGNILVPVDLTEKNTRAVAAAREVASRFAAGLTLLHVIATIDLPFEELSEFYGRLEAKAGAALAALSEPLQASGLEMKTHIAYGSRAQEIVRHAESHGIDLIVLSSRQLDPEDPSKNWATVSHKVAILARCPVLLVK